MPTFDISSHGLLSAKAKVYASGDASQQAEFDANVTGAELIHDLYGESFSSQEFTDLAKLILVHQVNFQFENDSNSDVYERLNEGDREFTYRDVAVSKMAETLRNKLADKVAGGERKPKQMTSSSQTNSVSW